jgi:hypothetical protein
MFKWRMYCIRGNHIYNQMVHLFVLSVVSKHVLLDLYSRTLPRKGWRYKEVIRICKSNNDGQWNDQKKKKNRQAIIRKALQRKLKIEHHGHVLYTRKPYIQCNNYTFDTIYADPIPFILIDMYSLCELYHTVVERYDKRDHFHFQFVYFPFWKQFDSLPCIPTKWYIYSYCR